MWPALLAGMRSDDTAAEAEGSVQSASYRLNDPSHRLNDSGIELVSNASSSSASDSWLTQVLSTCCLQHCH